MKQRIDELSAGFDGFSAVNANGFDDSAYIYIPEFTTKGKLKDFCRKHIIDEDIFHRMDDQMVSFRLKEISK